MHYCKALVLLQLVASITKMYHTKVISKMNVAFALYLLISIPHARNMVDMHTIILFKTNTQTRYVISNNAAQMLDRYYSPTIYHGFLGQQQNTE